MMRLLIPFFILSCIVNCRNSNGPELTLTKDRMRAILLDLHVAEAATYGQTRVFKDSMMVEYKSVICGIYNISEEELEFNLNVLKENPYLMSEMTTDIVDELQPAEE